MKQLSQVYQRVDYFNTSFIEALYTPTDGDITAEFLFSLSLVCHTPTETLVI